VDTAASSKTEPPPVLPEDAIRERINEVAMNSPADHAVNRDRSVAAPRAPKAV
jgi:hypothetical protein